MTARELLVDLSRRLGDPRLDAAFLARLVAEGRLTMARAERIIVDQTVTQPRKVFKL